MRDGKSQEKLATGWRLDLLNTICADADPAIVEEPAERRPTLEHANRASKPRQGFSDLCHLAADQIARSTGAA
jgi:hypothetical protein